MDLQKGDIQLTALKLDTLKSDESSKGGVIAATDALSYHQTPFLIQNKSLKRGVRLDPGNVRFEDCQLYCRRISLSGTTFSGKKCSSGTKSMLFDLTFPCYLTTFSGKECLSGKVACPFFVPFIEVLLYDIPVTYGLGVQNSAEAGNSSPCIVIPGLCRRQD
jgi:hypothetical protein